MAWWDLGGGDDGVAGDGPADAVRAALVAGGRVRSAQLLFELARMVLNHAQAPPYKRLQAIHIRANGEDTRVEGRGPVAPWAGALLRDLTHQWNERWKRGPNTVELLAAVEFVLGANTAIYTLDILELERMTPVFADERGQLDVNGSLSCLAAILVQTLADIGGGSGLVLEQVTAQFEDTAVCVSPAGFAEQRAVRSLASKVSKTMKEWSTDTTTVTLEGLLQLAFRAVAAERERFAWTQHGRMLVAVEAQVRLQHARVRHPKLGAGLVTEVRGNKSTILFDDGQQKVLLSTAVVEEVPAGGVHLVSFTLPPAYRAHLQT